MMKFSLLAPLCASALILSSCNTAEKYAQNNDAAAAWLAENKGNASTSISGSWLPGDHGWGMARLEQNGNQVTGAIGSYQVEGSINGKTAYLAMKDNGWVYYTAILKRTGKDFVGFYSDSVPFDSETQSTMLLTPKSH
jgi:hypothetical protein